MSVIFFKIIEMTFNDQVISYLDQNNPLYKFQAGLRKRTDTRLILLTDFRRIKVTLWESTESV